MKLVTVWINYSKVDPQQSIQIWIACSASLCVNEWMEKTPVFFTTYTETAILSSAI